MPVTHREFVDKRFEVLKSRRSSWLSHYQELAENILPRLGRFYTTEPRDGDKRNDKIINSTPTYGLRAISSGMLAGMSSPTSPWMDLLPPNEVLMENARVKEYLQSAKKRMYTAFSKSNVYRSLQKIYEEAALFGTGAMLVEEDTRGVIRTMTFTAGEYMLARDWFGKVAAFYREFEMTAEAIYSRFGEDNIPNTVKNAYDRGDYERRFVIRHCIEKNDGKFDLGLSQDREFRGAYWVVGSSQNDKSEFLEVVGYHECPIMAPAWYLNAGDDYGTSPAMDALGDCKQLQQCEIDKLSALPYGYKPPMIAPISMAGRKSSILPGSATYLTPEEIAQGAYRPAYQVNQSTQELSQEIMNIERRLNKTMFVDLFLMLASTDRRQITAREIEERASEKMLMLGPVLMNFNEDLHDPLIDRTFAIMQRNGLMPEPPVELEGIDLKVEYTSVLARAQRNIEAENIDRLVASTANLAGLKPEAIDKLNIDEAINDYSEIYGVNPKIVFSDEEAKQAREERMQQVQQQQAMQQAAAMADMASKAGNIPTGQGSMANAVAGL